MNFRSSSGFSLVELMLAMLIGLIIMGGVMQLFVSTRDTQRSSEDQLALLGDARFAIDTIAYDLRHAGVWGRHNNGQLIACHSDTTTALACPTGSEMGTATGDCVDYEYINFNAPVFGTDNSNPYAGTCANQSYQAGTDVLSVRYADTNWVDTADLEANVVYVRSNLKSGMVFKSAGATYPTSGSIFYKWDDATATSNHLLISRTYYVSDYTDTSGDGLPSLRRVDLTTGPALEGDVLLSGVENFQLEFGVDIGTDGVAGSDKDGQVDSYVKAGNVSSWSDGEVLSVRIWLLMRSDRVDRDNIGKAQEFTFAGETVTTTNDGYRRYLVSSVVKLRNVYQADLM